jgi:hypothetical protein
MYESSDNQALRTIINSTQAINAAVSTLADCRVDTLV